MSSNLRLRELIRAVRNCKTAQEERTVIAKECAAIRAALQERDPHRARNVAKLMYIHMLGYPTHFGQMECITLITSPEYTEKRIGYLGLVILLDEEQEVLPLIEHSLKKDLDDKNQFVQALALSTIANIANADICRDLSPDVEKLFINAPSYIRKKAALCGMRMVKKCPNELADNFVEKLDVVYTNEQHQRNHGVMITCIALTLEICRVKDESLRRKYILHFRKYIPVFVKILKGLLMSSYSLEHDIAGIADPFLQTSIIRLLRVLGKGSTKASEAMNDALAQVATNTEGAKNAGNSILYECVRTILDIESDKALRVLAINQLGKFLVNRDNNLRYVALHTLTKVVERDSAALNRHLNTIVDCLKDYDNSIRMRALELIYLLMNRENVKMLTGELILLLQELSHTNQTKAVIDNGGEALRQNLTTKLCTLVEKHASDDDLETRKWKLETFLKIITISGQFVREEIASIFIGLVTQSPELQAEFTLKLFTALRKFIPKPHLINKLDILVQVAVWCVGEFGDLIVGEQLSDEQQKNNKTELLETENNQTSSTITPQEIVRVLERVMEIVFRENTTTRSYIMTAVVKFCAKYPILMGEPSDEMFKSSEQQFTGVIQFLRKFSTDFNLELQQRACEFTKLLGLDQELVSHNILDRMPAIEIDRIVHLLMAGEVGGKKFTVKRKGDDETDEASDVATNDDTQSSSSSVSQPPTTTIASLISFDDDETISSNKSNGNNQPSVDLDALFGNLGASSQGNTNTNGNIVGNGVGGGNLLDLDQLLSGPSAPIPNTPQKPVQDKYAGAKILSVYSKNGVTVRMLVKQNDPVNHPELTHVITQFGNSSDQTVTNLSFLCAVPKYVKLHIFKVSSEQIPPHSELGSVTQKMKLENTQHTQRGISAVKYQIKYTLNGNNQVVDQGTIQF